MRKLPTIAFIGVSGLVLVYAAAVEMRRATPSTKSPQPSMPDTANLSVIPASPPGSNVLQPNASRATVVPPNGAPGHASNRAVSILPTNPESNPVHEEDATSKAVEKLLLSPSYSDSKTTKRSIAGVVGPNQSRTPNVGTTTVSAVNRPPSQALTSPSVRAGQHLMRRAVAQRPVFIANPHARFARLGPGGAAPQALAMAPQQEGPRIGLKAKLLEPFRKLKSWWKRTHEETM